MRKARDLALLDAVDAFARIPLRRSVWRIVREARDPLAGTRSRSRWCNDTFDVLYASFERDGALAEIHALLTSQPVFPSKLKVFAHRVSVDLSRTLHLPDLDALATLGVDISRYRERAYQRTQDIADAAHFLDFQGLVVPSARWNCSTLVVFTDRIHPDDLRIEHSEERPIDWDDWRKNRRP